MFEQQKLNYNDYIYDVFKEYPDQLEDKYIGTGISKIDQALQGGIRRGEIGTILAESQAGKSTVLTIIGANCYNNGYKVAHFIYEDYWKDIRNQYKNLLKENNSGQLRLVDCVSKPFKINEVEKLNDEHKFDVIIIDYAEIMPCTYNIKDIGKRFLLRENFIEIRRLAGRTSTVIWSAHQATIQRTLEGRPLLRLTDDRVSECRAIKATTDIMIGFSLNDPFDQFIYCTIMKAKHRPKPLNDFFKLAVDFSIPRIWSE